MLMPVLRCLRNFVSRGGTDPRPGNTRRESTALYPFLALYVCARLSKELNSL